MPPRGLGAKKERPKNAKGTTLRILKYVMNYRYVVLALLVLTLISNVGNLLGPTFAGKGGGDVAMEEIVLSAEALELGA